MINRRAWAGVMTGGAMLILACAPSSSDTATGDGDDASELRRRRSDAGTGGGGDAAPDADSGTTPPPPPPTTGHVPTTIAHGSELTHAMVGPAALGVALNQLRPTHLNGSRLGSWPTDDHPWDAGGWIPNAPYVYNNDPNNHGGFVPAGGMTIDGFFVPAGTWVAQFDDFGSDSVIVNGDSNGATAPFPGIVFRGCRWRGPITAPGYINIYQNSNTRVWILYSDAGGLGASTSETNEIPFCLNDRTTANVLYRNYISYTTTGIEPNAAGPQIIENFIEKITFFAPLAHLNGIQLNGGQTNALLLRNKVLLQSPDDAGRVINQTDAIALAQDFGTYPGTGTNLDGSRGYMVKDNYVGGGGYSIYAGYKPSIPNGGIANLTLTGNQVTTQWWPNGGYYGPVAYEAQWGSNGNTKSGNTFAESKLPW